MSTLRPNGKKLKSDISFHWNSFPTTKEKIEKIVGEPNLKTKKSQNAWSIILTDYNGDEHEFTMYDDFGNEEYSDNEIIIWLIGCKSSDEGKFIEKELSNIFR